MTNPKLIFEGDNLFVIDEPEMPRSYCGGKPFCCEGKRCERLVYQEALSKAPRWEVRNYREIGKELLLRLNPNSYASSLFQPEHGKLYDLPKGYSVKFEKKPLTWDDFGNTNKYQELALIIPQAEEVKEDKKELQEIIAKVHDDIEGRYELDSYDKGIIHSLLCKLQ